MKIKSILLLAIATLFFSCQNKVNIIEPLKADQSIVRGQLENGFSYIIKENHQIDNQVVIYFVVKAGSVLEEDEEQGIAHFLEHMAFYSSDYFSGKSVSAYFESIGATFGADTNAYTSFNETVYTLTLPITTEEAMSETFNIIKGWAEGLHFNNDDINRERGAVLEELRRGLNASSRIFNAQWPALLGDTIYAHRLPIGKIEVIQRADHEYFTKFYKKWYQSQLQSIIIVGDFDKKAMEQRVKSTFGSLVRGDSLPPTMDFKPLLNNVFQVNTDPELTRNSLSLYYPRQEEELYQTIEDFQRSVSDLIIYNMINNRLNRLAIIENSPLISAGAGSMTIGHSQQYFVMSTNYKEGMSLEAYKELTQVITQARTFGFTQSELTRAKDYLLTQMELAANEAEHQQSVTLAQRYLRAILSNGIITDTPYEYALAKKIYPTITLDLLNNTFSDHTSGKAINLLAASTVEQNIPTSKELELYASSLNQLETNLYIDETIVNEDLYTAPKKPGKIIKTTTLSQDITQWELSNGINIFIKPTAVKKDELLFYAWGNGGYYSTNDALFAAATVTLPFLEESGLGPWNSVELEQRLNTVNVSLSPFFTNYTKGFSGYSDNKDFESLLKLLYLYSNEIPSDQASFNRLKVAYDQYYLGRRGTPGEVFGIAVYQSLYGTENPRYHYPTFDFYKSINLDDISQFYRHQINEIALAEMSYFIVGSIDQKKLKPLVERYLASLPKRSNHYNPPTITPVPSPLQQPIIVYNGIEDQANLHVNYSFTRLHNPDDAIYWAALERLAQIRLFDAVRGDIGATYSPNVAISREELSSRVNMSIRLTLEPSRIDEVRNLIDNEVNSIFTSSLDDDYYHKAQKTLQESEKSNRQENSYWLTLMASYHQRGIDFSNIKKRDYYLNHINKQEMSNFLKELDQNRVKSEAIRLPAKQK